MTNKRDREIKRVLASSYRAILTAITDEDGLDGAVGRDVMGEILKLFKTPFPPVNHGKIEDCPFTGKHNYSECGLSVPLDLSGEGFELK